MVLFISLMSVLLRRRDAPRKFNSDLKRRVFDAFHKPERNCNEFSIATKLYQVVSFGLYKLNFMFTSRIHV